MGNSRIKKWRSNKKEIDSKDREKPKDNDPPLPRRGCPPPPIELTLKPKTFRIILKIGTIFFKNVHDNVMRKLLTFRNKHDAHMSIARLSRVRGETNITTEPYDCTRLFFFREEKDRRTRQL